MIFQPAIIALLVGSILISFMLIYSAYYGIRILRKWDIKNGSDLQLSLERRTYLISTIMNYGFGFQLISLFLFIYTVDHLNTLFVGAMCAAGTLNVNQWGYPTIIMKVVNFLLAGLWLIINFTDNKAYDYPLIKKKYGFFLFIIPFILVEAVLQANFFLGLKPDVITSCCGTLFTSESQGITSEIVSFPRVPVETAFYSAMVLTFALGTCFYLKGKGAYLFSLASITTFVVSVIALISFVCLYFYELPTHHCPFCILQKEYSYIGYPIYLTFLGGAVSGMGVGGIMPFRRINSLKEIVPSIQKRLSLLSLLSYALFMAIVVYQIIASNLILK
ncbi:MAG TPA: hypothetical protein VLK23_04275 [Thermodesulfobacteriota bacterium]|nr:hypothetical protein [Thermodesulfobacteriota bacterium]